MIIKKWNGASWDAQSPKVTFTDIVDDVTAGTPVSIFDSGKLRLNYLPDAVFDSLYFQATLGANSTAAAIAAKLDDAIDDAETASRSIKGFYFQINVAGEIDPQPTGIQQTVSPDNYFTWSFNNNDEGDATNPTDSSGQLEVGDWIVVENVSGSGTSGSPYAINFSVVNNVYEIMTAATGAADGAPGLVPTPPSGADTKFLRGDASWQTISDTDTTYTISAVDSGADAIIRLTAGGSGSGTDDVKLVAGSNITLTPSGDNITIEATDTNTTYTAGDGIDLSGPGEFSVAGGEGLTQEASGLAMTYPVYHGNTLPESGISTNAIGFEW